MKTTIRFSLLASALLLSLHAAADDAAQNLDRVQVTGSRLPLDIDKSTASVTVLTRDDIERSQAIDVSDLLAQQVGIDIVRAGGSGAQNSLFLRGGNSNHTLILIDGVRVNSATQGLFDFAHLPLANIERIEIVRGPRAAFWGSDAISGVIQIFTRAPKKLSADLSLGSYQRIGGNLGFGIGDEDNNVGVIAGVDSTDGFSSTNSGNVWSYDPDNDGYDNRRIGLNAQAKLGTQTLKFSGIATQAEVEFDQGLTDADNHSWSAGLSGQLAESWSHALTIGQAYEKLDTPAYASTYGSTRNSIDWAHAVRINPAAQLGFGLNWSEEDGYSNGWSGPEFNETRRNTGVFAVLDASHDAHNFELATRFDDNDQYGTQLTSSAGWSWQIDAGNRVRASWGQGFRAPNFNELYYPGFYGSFAGNPDLQPEQSDSLELGYILILKEGLSAEFSAYQSNVEDLISFTGDNNNAENISRARIRGIEAELRGQENAWQWRLQGTWTDAVNQDTGLALLRRPEWKGLAALNYQFNSQARLGAELTAYSDRPDFGTTLPGYGRLDLTASWPINDAWRLEGRLENLLDKDYQVIDGYNTPDRSFFVRISYQAQ
ncbi:MAG: TonB-dependent receptor [Arenimonas sp.]|nr:TonB-dependent receptor [Arenimonas sp.]